MGLVIGVGWITMLTRSMEEPLHKIYANNPVFYQLFGGHDIGTNAGFLAGAIFAFVPAITVIFDAFGTLAVQAARYEVVTRGIRPFIRQIEFGLGGRLW